MQRQLEALDEQIPQHRIQDSLVFHGLGSLGGDLETVGIQPGGSAGYLIGPHSPGACDAPLQRYVVGRDAAVAGRDAVRPARLGGAGRFYGCHFKLLSRGHRGA